MSLVQWPTHDQELWNSALAVGNLFDESGPAARWRPKTANQARYAYGTWLQFLDDSDPHALALPAADRVTVERMRPYVDRLAARVSRVSVAANLGHLILALRAIAPTRDWQWLARFQRKELALAKPTDKRASMVPVDDLVALGYSLMADREAKGKLIDLLAYRDGLVIALLASRPLRRANFASIRIGQHLSIAGPEVGISFEAHEMKGGRPFECWVEGPLAAKLVHYIYEVRAQLPGAASHDFLWCSSKRGALTADGLYRMISRRTEKRFGHSVHPHLFRDIAASAIAIDQPEETYLARELLGHARIETTERHYLHGQSVKAGKHYLALIESLRCRKARSERR